MPLPLHMVFLLAMLFSSGLWALLSDAISFRPSNSFPCIILQTGRPGSIISRTRIWQPSLKAKHKLCRGLMMPQRRHLLLSTHLWALVHPANELWPSLQPSLGKPLPSHFCMHPQRAPLLAVRGHWSLAQSTANLCALPLHTLIFKYSLTWK